MDPRRWFPAEAGPLSEHHFDPVREVRRTRRPIPIPSLEVPSFAHLEDDPLRQVQKVGGKAKRATRTGAKDRARWRFHEAIDGRAKAQVACTTPDVRDEAPAVCHQEIPELKGGHL